MKTKGQFYSLRAFFLVHLHVLPYNRPFCGSTKAFCNSRSPWNCTKNQKFNTLIPKRPWGIGATPGHIQPDSWYALTSQSRWRVSSLHHALVIPGLYQRASITMTHPSFWLAYTDKENESQHVGGKLKHATDNLKYRLFTLLFPFWGTVTGCQT